MPPSKTALSTGSLGSKPRMIVDFIDVGQGCAVLVSYPFPDPNDPDPQQGSPGRYMLVDCGSQEKSVSGSAFRNAQQYINAVVGLEWIQTVVMTHGDRDHTIFVPRITQAQNPTYVHFGGSIGDYDPPVQAWIRSWEKSKTRRVFRYPSSGYSLPSPDADFGTSTYDNDANVTVLSANRGSNPNERSIVLLLQYGSVRIILMGDAEMSTEWEIIDHVPNALVTNCTVLMPGHHGAYMSTSHEWVELLEPKISAISASAGNSGYAHPDCITLGMLKGTALDTAQKHGVACSTAAGDPYKIEQTKRAVFDTSTNGDIRFTTDGTNYNVKVTRFADQVVTLPAAKVRTGLVRNAPLVPAGGR